MTLQFKKVLQYNSYANCQTVSPKLTPNVCRCPFFGYSMFSLLSRRLVIFNGTATLIQQKN